MRYGLAFVVVCATAVVVSASQDEPRDIPARAQGAHRVVVAKVGDVYSRFDINRWGDQLIVSESIVDVEETLKGAHVGSLRLRVEGGTVGDLTLTVSDMPRLTRGQRAVLFLDEEPGGSHVLHGRGAGLIEVDGAGRVKGTSLTVQGIGRLVRQSR